MGSYLNDQNSGYNMLLIRENDVHFVKKGMFYSVGIPKPYGGLINNNYCMSFFIIF